MAPTSQALTSPSPPSAEPGTLLLETDRLLLRRHLPSDAPSLAAAANHASIAANLRSGFPSPYTLADAQHFLSLSLRSSSAETDHRYYPTTAAILLKQPHTNTDDTGDPSSPPYTYIGALGIVPHTDAVYRRTWELGYWLTPSAWGRGYATEAVRAAVPWMFDTWPALNRVEAVVYAGNGASAGVLRKAGFVEEGRKRGCVEKGGEIRDELMFGITRGDLGCELSMQ